MESTRVSPSVSWEGATWNFKAGNDRALFLQSSDSHGCCEENRLAVSQKAWRPARSPLSCWEGEGADLGGSVGSGGGGRAALCRSREAAVWRRNRKRYRVTHFFFFPVSSKDGKHPSEGQATRVLLCPYLNSHCTPNQRGLENPWNEECGAHEVLTGAAHLEVRGHRTYMMV